MKSPYKGLQPLSVEDGRILAGRTRDIQVIISSLYGSSLTILYGESGVGKTSLIRAGLVPELERSEHRVATVVFREWQSKDFEARLRTAVLQAVVGAINRLLEAGADDDDDEEEQEAGSGNAENSDGVAGDKGADGATGKKGRAHREPLTLEKLKEAFAKGLKTPLEKLPLDRFMKECCGAFYGRLFFVFDQFEEYFYYHPSGEEADQFDMAFARAVNSPDISASFLVSLREDGLAKLDRLRGRIPGLLGNLIRLGHLNVEGAREAMNLPLAGFNAQNPAVQIAIEPALENALIGDEKTPGQVREDVMELEDNAEAQKRNQGGPETWRYRVLAIEAVMHRLWDFEIEPALTAQGGVEDKVKRPPLQFTLRGLQRLAAGPALLSEEDFVSSSGLLKEIQSADPLSHYLWESFTESSRLRLNDVKVGVETKQQILLQSLNDVIRSQRVDERLVTKPISDETRIFLNASSEADDLSRLNRLLLLDAYPTFLRRYQQIEESAAKTVVRTYFDGKMRKLEQDKVDDVSEILRTLVRSGGKKKARTVKQLAGDTGLPVMRVHALLEKLVDEDFGILIKVRDSQPPEYELQHDVMAFALKDWCDRRRQIKQERLAVLQVEEAFQREQQQRHIEALRAAREADRKLTEEAQLKAAALEERREALEKLAEQEREQQKRDIEALRTAREADRRLTEEAQLKAQALDERREALQKLANHERNQARRAKWQRGIMAGIALAAIGCFLWAMREKRRADSAVERSRAALLANAAYQFAGLDQNYLQPSQSIFLALDSLPRREGKILRRIGVDKPLLAPPRGLIALRFATQYRYADAPQQGANWLNDQLDYLQACLPFVFSLDAKHLVTMEDRVPRVWDVAKQMEWELDLAPSKKPIRAMAISEDSKKFLAETEEGVIEWTLDGKSVEQRLGKKLSELIENPRLIHGIPEGYSSDAYFSYSEIRDRWVLDAMLEIAPLGNDALSLPPGLRERSFPVETIVRSFEFTEKDRAKVIAQALEPFVNADDASIRDLIARRAQRAIELALQQKVSKVIADANELARYGPQKEQDAIKTYEDAIALDPKLQGRLKPEDEAKSWAAKGYFEYQNFLRQAMDADAKNDQFNKEKARNAALALRPDLVLEDEIEKLKNMTPSPK